MDLEALAMEETGMIEKIEAEIGFMSEDVRD